MGCRPCAGVGRGRQRPRPEGLPQSLYDSWEPKVNVPNVTYDRPAWNLYDGRTPRLSSLSAYGEQ